MEICAIGGYEQVGKNMTAVKTGDDVFIFDAGLYIPGIVELQEEAVLEYTHRLKQKAEPQKFSESRLREFGALPDDSVLDKLGWRDKVRAIFLSHAHLDHLGGAPYIINRYPQATVFATPFTMKVFEAIIEDENMKVKNYLKVVQPDSFQLIKGKSGTYKVDFIHATHSTLHCIFIALHTKEGIFFYALDLKFDNYPTLGKPPNYKKLKEIGKQGVKALVIDALYSSTEKKAGGERIAQHMLEDAFSKIRSRNCAFFVTTFSSHIERLNNIVSLAGRTGREVIFIGRSLNKYVEAASKVNSCPFKNKIKIISYRKQVDSFLKKLDKERGRYLVVCTGHQAEENSILDRIAKGHTDFNFRQGDHLIFSSSVIPVPINIIARERMDNRLRKIGVKIQTDVHVHGHGSREDMRELIDILRPKHIIPAHGTLQHETPLIELANDLGYKLGETSHLLSNGKTLRL